MKRTDYSKIASKYDANPSRSQSGKDNLIQVITDRYEGEQLQIIDIACGTGNYIKKQQEFYTTEDVKWYGLDYSKDMLEVANKKLKNVELTIADAQSLPYEDSYFHYISCNNAFHHFIDKEKVISEMHRVLKPNGILQIGSMTPEFSDKHWVFYFFPETRIEDMKRFWSHELIFREIENKGMIANAEIQYNMERVPLKELYSQAKNKDLSKLNIISEADFERGIRRMEAELEYDDNATYLNCMAYMVIRGTKK